MSLKYELRGVNETLRGLEQFERKVLSNLQSVADAMAKPVEASAKVRAPYRDGDLSRSIETTKLESGGQNEAWAAVGSTLSYARRRELGFTGVDSLGRHYNDPATPYLRPPLDQDRGIILREAASAVRRIL